MTFVNVITGLIIAALLHVPGAMQHEVPQVGDELVEMVTVEKMFSNQYWVIGEDGDDYLLTNQTPDLSDCNPAHAMHPCEILTDLDFSSLRVPKDEILDNPLEVQIENYRNTFD